MIKIGFSAGWIILAVHFLNYGNEKPVLVPRWTAAALPFPVPGSDDVLFLSARTDLASIWIASPGKPDRQITNVGKTKMDTSFVPVFGQELVWVQDGRAIVYTASYGTHALLFLQIDSGKAKRLGPSRRIW